MSLHFHGSFISKVAHADNLDFPKLTIYVTQNTLPALRSSQMYFSHPPTGSLQGLYSRARPSSCRHCVPERSTVAITRKYPRFMLADTCITTNFPFRSEHVSHFARVWNRSNNCVTSCMLQQLLIPFLFAELAGIFQIFDNELSFWFVVLVGLTGCPVNSFQAFIGTFLKIIVLLKQNGCAISIAYCANMKVVLYCHCKLWCAITILVTRACECIYCSCYTSLQKWLLMVIARQSHKCAISILLSLPWNFDFYFQSNETR